MGVLRARECCCFQKWSPKEGVGVSVYVVALRKLSVVYNCGHYLDKRLHSGVVQCRLLSEKDLNFWKGCEIAVAVDLSSKNHIRKGLFRCGNNKGKYQKGSSVLQNWMHSLVMQKERNNFSTVLAGTGSVVAGGTSFSKPDLSYAYQQLLLDERSEKDLMFCTQGLWNCHCLGCYPYRYLIRGGALKRLNEVLTGLEKHSIWQETDMEQLEVHANLKMRMHWWKSCFVH